MEIYKSINILKNFPLDIECIYGYGKNWTIFNVLDLNSDSKLIIFFLSFVCFSQSNRRFPVGRYQARKFATL